MENIISGLTKEPNPREVVYIDHLLTDVKERRKVVESMAESVIKFKPTKLVCFLEKGSIVASLVADKLNLPIVAFSDKTRPCVGYMSVSLGEEKRLYVLNGLLTIDDKIVIVDDYLGSAMLTCSAIRLINRIGAKAVGAVYVAENHSDITKSQINGVPVHSIFSQFTMRSPDALRRSVS
jgi:adenine/guanine phosphoribosyltransferase-like PRPP-binding protein